MNNSKRKKSTVVMFFMMCLLMSLSLPFFLRSPQSTVQLVEMKQELASSYMNNQARSILSDVSGIESAKILPFDFTVPEHAPNPDAFTYTQDGKVYYSDSTIEVSCWRERNIFDAQRHSDICLADVKIKHASQFRRQWANGDYNSKGYQFPSNIFSSTNGVVGMSADFYKHRKYGVIVQYGNVICDKRGRCSLDVLVIDYKGNFHVWNDTELSEHIAKNGADDIMLSFTFGPVLVQDGKLVEVAHYANQGLGELFFPQSRAGIGQLGELHYLLCVTTDPGASVYRFAKYMQEKGCKTVYNLDGGQTGTLLVDGKTYNRIAYYGVERAMSDIIYFASAE